MTLQEAIKTSRDSHGLLWFRPVSWKNRGEAFVVDRRSLNIEIVPTPRGGSQYMVFSVSLLLGEWEVVTPDEVFGETE